MKFIRVICASSYKNLLRKFKSFNIYIQTIYRLSEETHFTNNISYNLTIYNYIQIGSKYYYSLIASLFVSMLFFSQLDDLIIISIR